MARMVTVTDENTHFLINQAYAHGGKYQWAREAAVNSMQAHATWIEFGIEEQILAKHGVSKRYVADNGIGMNEEQLVQFMAAFGGGGKPIGLNDNFGQGLKASTFMWNPFGVVVVSWTPETPDGLMIWIRRGNELNPDDGNFYLKDFLVRNDDGEADMVEVVTPHYDHELDIDLSKLKTPEIAEAGHGTVFLFLGDSLERHTEHGDYLKDEFSQRGIVQFLNRRFIRLPKALATKGDDDGTGKGLRVVALESATVTATPKKWKKKEVSLPDGKTALHARMVRGLSSFVPKPAAGESWVGGNVKVDEHGTMVSWVLAPTAGVDGDNYGSYGPAGAQIFIEHQSSYDGVEISEAYHPVTSLTLYRKFGVNSDNVAKRLWMRIKPPAYQEGSPGWGVYPNPSRSSLVAKGGAELPVEDWADEFFRQFPEPIRLAIDLDRAGMVTSTTKIYGRAKELLSRLNMRMKPKRLVQTPDGHIAGVPGADYTGKSRVGAGGSGGGGTGHGGSGGGNKDTGGTGDIPLLSPEDKAPHKGIEKPRGDGMPAVVWVSATDWTDGPTCAAVYVANDPRLLDDGSMSVGTIQINEGFPMFPNEFTYWINEYPKAGSADVIEIVKDAYALELITKVSHARKLRGEKIGTRIVNDKEISIRFSENDVEKLLSREGLTLAVLGLLNVEQRIRTVAGSKFGKMASSAA